MLSFVILKVLNMTISKSMCCFYLSFSFYLLPERLDWQIQVAHIYTFNQRLHVAFYWSISACFLLDIIREYFACIRANLVMFPVSLEQEYYRQLAPKPEFSASCISNLSCLFCNPLSRLFILLEEFLSRLKHDKSLAVVFECRFLSSG